MKVVVTGGAGFIGSSIVRDWLARADVHVVDDHSLGSEANVPSEATVHRASILDEDALRKAFAGADLVFHEAALPSVPRSVKDPLASDAVNARGTLLVLEAARHAGVKKVIYAASSSAYGDTPTLPKHEEMPSNPRSPYAVSKLTGENYCRVYAEVYGLRTTALRYFNVYGPRQRLDGSYAAVIPRFLRAAARGEPLTIQGDGTQSRDFTYIDDVVRANALAANTSASDGLVINVGGGARTTILELARLSLEVTGSRSAIVHAEPRPGDVPHSLADLSRARAKLGYTPRYRLLDGIKETYAWIREVST